MPHRNAKLSIYSRHLIIERLELGWRQAEVAEAAGVSRCTVAKWARRYREEGIAGLRDRSSKARRCRHDLGEDVLMPGVVDTHVHVNEPGRTEWEGFATATAAAAAGGVTSLVDMPLNSVPATTSVAALREKQRTAEGQLWIDVGFWGGVVPGNLGELAGMAEAGAIGFKCFLVESGVDEFQFVREADVAVVRFR